MSPDGNTSAPGAVDWVARALARKNTAPPTAKTDEITVSSSQKMGHPTAITDETPHAEAITSVSAVLPAALGSRSEPPGGEERPAPRPVNPGMLMTMGHYHGYPRLPFKPGVSIAEGDIAWRTFTRTAPADMLALAAEAARLTWSDDPMTNDLYGLGPDHTGDDACRNENGVCQDSTHDHFDLDDFIDERRAAQEDRYLEHGAKRGAA